MSKTLLSILMATTILATGSVMAQAPSFEADDAQVMENVEKQRPPKRFDREKHEEMAKKMAKDLGLTAEQQEQAEAIRKEGQEKIKPLMDEMKALREKIDAERKANMEEFEKILTPEQKEKLKEIQKRGLEEMNRRLNDKRGPGMRGHADRPAPEPRRPNEDMRPRPDGEMLPPPPIEDNEAALASTDETVESVIIREGGHLKE